MRNKKLYIIRHAKAEDHFGPKIDFERNLVDKGRERARELSAKLNKELPSIDERTLVISSTASRAAETATLFCDTLGYPVDRIEWEPKIYEAHFLVILKRINDVSANYDNLLVFGHNPGLSDLINYVSNDYVDLKTSHIGCLTLEDNIDFSNLSANTAKLNKVIHNVNDY